MIQRNLFTKQTDSCTQKVNLLLKGQVGRQNQNLGLADTLYYI